MRSLITARNPIVAGEDKTLTPTNAAHATGQSSAEAIVHAITERRMMTPFLLFLASHKPLAFAMEQLLYMVEPLAGLLNVSACSELAALLSESEDTMHALDRRTEAG